MQYLRKVIRQAISSLLAISLLAGCSTGEQMDMASQAQSTPVPKQTEPVQFRVDPETFSLELLSKETVVPVSLPGTARRVENLSESETETRWDYPEESVSVSIKPETDSLLVTVTSLEKNDHAFTWPLVSGEQYYLPLGEGKRIVPDNDVWSNYLSGKEFSALEQLSMPFWVSVHGEHAAMVILENPFRSKLVFSEKSEIAFRLEHQYPEIDPEKENRFRIYLTDADPVSAAKMYRNYIIKQGRFVTLEEKAKQNPNIEKLYGAPHIYLWGDYLISPEDVNWGQFRSAIGSDPMRWILSLDNEAEAATVFEQASKQDYVDNYQKNVICRVLSEAMKREDFYNPEKLSKQDATMQTLLARSADTLSIMEQLQLHKHALEANFPGVFKPVENWMDSNTVDLIKDLKEAGLEKAWIGLNSWEQAYAKPELVETAEQEGYLIAAYDSYHSIHEPGNEQWITAKFDDPTLYENATVQKQNGEKAAGFQNVGRKLNPTLAVPAVKRRLESIFGTGLPFNSWFIDCDATGEIYDDYTPTNRTTQQQDLAARLERMTFAQNEYGMVVGSEGGNDFAASSIAFAHGIELPTFSWMDEDMKKNKESPYYIGGYFSSTGGVAAHFAKQIPIKEEFYTIFVDPRYDLPLFKLVYNDSLVTGYHWDWSTFKIEAVVQDRMLREVLYNTPPLYHLDRDEWAKYGQAIQSHSAAWSQFSMQAIRQEMTGFESLNEDHSVQRTEYGEGLSVVANFSNSTFTYEKQEIPPHALLMELDGKLTVYAPSDAIAGT